MDINELIGTEFAERNPGTLAVLKHFRSGHLPANLRAISEPSAP